VTEDYCRECERLETDLAVAAINLARAEATVRTVGELPDSMVVERKLAHDALVRHVVNCKFSLQGVMP
jgi:hypothetical protein